jgi:hypothetical protein
MRSSWASFGDALQAELPGMDGAIVTAPQTISAAINRLQLDRTCRKRDDLPCGGFIDVQKLMAGCGFCGR